MLRMLLFVAVASCSASVFAEAPSTQVKGPFYVVVMDPLAAPLACDCVQGYAQRKYERLGEYLQRELRRPVKVVWSESLKKALEDQTAGQAHLIIGKHSVVRHDAGQAKLAVTPLMSLTDQEGHTTQHGLIVVRKDDPAKSTTDLQGYRIIFGPEDCDEKWAAPRAALKAAGIPIDGLKETAPSCSNAATLLMELDSGVKAAAVISSYATPLLEGCGTIKAGDLRVIGKSGDVPFITAFAGHVDDATRAALQQGLAKVSEDADLLIALETLGFVPFDGGEPAPAAVSKKKD